VTDFIADKGFGRFVSHEAAAVSRHRAPPSFTVNKRLRPENPAIQAELIVQSIPGKCKMKMKNPQFQRSANLRQVQPMRSSLSVL
jgi:hypothetical protein